MARALVRAEISDGELVSRIVSGESELFTTLYRRHVDMVYALLTRLIGPGSEREDLVQVVFVAVFKALPTYRSESSLSTFIYTICSRQAYTSLRKRPRRTASIEGQDVVTIPEARVGPSQRASDRQELARAFETLAKLTPKQRIAFVLVAIDGKSLKEAGFILGVRPQAVKQRVLSARRYLTSHRSGPKRPAPTIVKTLKGQL